MERKKPGRRSKGDRPQLNVRQPRALLQAAQEKASARGMTLTDYVGHLLADDTGVPYDAQEGLSLSA